MDGHIVLAFFMYNIVYIITSLKGKNDLSYCIFSRNFAIFIHEYACLRPERSAIVEKLVKKD